MEQHLSVRNATRAATAWAASPVGRLARIEILVSLSCCLLAVLVLLGSGRRASRSAVLRFAVWSALMLSYPAVSYTIGLMQSASFRNEFIVAWGCFLLLLLGSADGIAAYSLSDSDQQARTVLNQGLQLVYVFLLLLSYLGALPLQLKVLLVLLWALSIVKLVMRIRSSVLAGRDRVLTAGNKLIADYMSREHESGVVGYDAPSMTGYRYVVFGEEGAEQQDGLGGYRTIDPSTNADLVTVDRVWECEEMLLRTYSKHGPRNKDLCLSFALFKLLRRRLGGYPLHESSLNKTRDFVKLGLLQGDDYKRMYRIIEVELGFLFDFFYARYPSHKETLIQDTVVFAAVVTTSLLTLLSPALLEGYRVRNGAQGSIATTRFDIWLTRIMIILFITLESFQYFSLVFSDWHKVKMLCRCVRDESWQQRPVLQKVLGFMCSVRLTGYWNNALGQHCVLQGAIQYDCSSLFPLPRYKGCYVTRSSRMGRMTLPVVKCAIYKFLQSNLTRIQHGEYTLRHNGLLGDFLWAISKESTVHNILIWHIATAICQNRNASFIRDAVENGTVENSLVALTLSRYCAYLMSSAPELLPDHSYDTQLLVEAVRLRAQLCWIKCPSLDDFPSMLTQVEPNDDYGAILAEGKRLADEIEQKMPLVGVRWKVLAELWVEMLLSVAPSDNVAAHIKKLATGGELITHLWALLTHAGMVEKRLNRYQCQNA